MKTHLIAGAALALLAAAPPRALCGGVYAARKDTAPPAPPSDDERAKKLADDQAAAAEAATKRAEEEGRMPEGMAVTNPAPATEMDSGSGAFVEPEIKAAIPVDHPSIENNPRAGTSAIQNGGDFNDPRRRHPSDPEFAGQGLDTSVYGDGPKPDVKAKD